MQMINVNLQVNSMKAPAVQGITLQGMPLQKASQPVGGFQALLMATMKAPDETQTEEPAELPVMAGIWMTPPLVPQEEGLPQNQLTTISQGTTIQDQNIPGMTEIQQLVNPEVLEAVPAQPAVPEGNQPVAATAATTTTSAATVSKPAVTAVEETSGRTAMTLPESNMVSNPIPEQKGSPKAWGHLDNPAIGKASENSALYEKSPELTEAIPQGIQQRMTSEGTPVNSIAPEQAQQTERPAPFVQVADKIAEAAAKGEPTALKMTLNPEQLGEIEIKIDMTQGKLQIGITAEKPETLNLLSGQLEKLTTRLGLQQFQIEGITLNPAVPPIQPNSNPGTNTNLHHNLAGGMGWQLGQQMGEGRNGESNRTNSPKGTGKIQSSARMDIPETAGIQASSRVPQSNRLDYTV